MSLHELPPDLPVPRDDGACAHLPSRALPDVALAATSGEQVDPGKIPGRVVLSVYPLSGRPGRALPDGWDAIPGARGCTPEACGFRDHHADMTARGTVVFGLSAQSTADQREFRDRLGLPFHLLSDEDFDFANALALPAFQAGSRRLLPARHAHRPRLENRPRLLPGLPAGSPRGEVSAALRQIDDEQRGGSNF